MIKYFKSTVPVLLHKVEQIKIEQKRLNDAIIAFFAEHGIDGKHYYTGADGSFNAPVEEYHKKDIVLYIEPTEAVKEKYGNQFKQKYKDPVQALRQNSPLLKAWAEIVMRDKLWLNFWSPKPMDWFKECGMGGYRYSRFVLDGVFYCCVDKDGVENFTVNQHKDKETGEMVDDVTLTEISGSEYHLAVAEYEKRMEAKE